jgi:hypothetical protein
MNEEPKSIWKKSWKGPGGLLLWFIILTGVAFLIILSIGYMSAIAHPFGRLVFFSFLYAMGWALAAVLVIAFFHWVWCWRNFKKFLFGCACVATLIAVFYAEEDWRGKYDWERFKREWETKGENFDKQSVVPPSVPDEENFAMSPVWIAEEKHNFLTEPKHAEAWYGDRIYSEDVSNFLRLLPVSTTAVVGTNWPSWVPETPEASGDWATAWITDLKPWQSFYRNLEETKPAANISITPQPQSPAADVLLALSKYDPLIEQLRRDSQRPYSRFPLEYDAEDPAAILLPHLAEIKQCASVLRLRAVAELQNGQSDKALDDIKLMLRLSDSIRTEPILISFLVRIAIVQITIQPIYEGLANHEWSDAQLAELDSELGKQDFLDGYKLALRGEMVVFQGGIFDYLRHQPERLNNIAGESSGGPMFPSGFIANLIPSGWFYQNQLSCARVVEEYCLPLVDENRGVVSPSSVHQAEASAMDKIHHVNPYNVFASMLMPVLSSPVQKCAYAQNAVTMARVAVALERYRLAHGAFPDLLDALSPQFIQPIPHDIINGDPLQYERTGDKQFVLYSVGWNEKDDGGVVVFKKPPSKFPDIDEGDWVWQYPEKQ